MRLVTERHRPAQLHLQPEALACDRLACPVTEMQGGKVDVTVRRASALCPVIRSKKARMKMQI